MKQVYLIRHAQPDFPGGQKRCIGSTDLGLSPQGFAQAEAMAAALPPVVCVFSSDLQRSVQTAQAVGKPILLPGLRELHMGAWENLTFDTIRETFPELYAARRSTLCEASHNVDYGK